MGQFQVAYLLRLQGRDKSMAFNWKVTTSWRSVSENREGREWRETCNYTLAVILWSVCVCVSLAQRGGYCLILQRQDYPVIMVWRSELYSPWIHYSQSLRWRIVLVFTTHGHSKHKQDNTLSGCICFYRDETTVMWWKQHPRFEISVTGYSPISRDSQPIKLRHLWTFTCSIY